ncbi:hypothetical protein HDC90_001367 [Pedobacter sp. AK013]|uniref:hypothetical protein n=1 Tax=Pedobacter sp. AK013 TaxID=2723071 RepID=UPI0016220CAB|nr:hypothetical protein [Pedobacter sp. AK013]MBB6236755.1 hypothetical protein [Pedobacter sp. AK013]
MTGKIDAPLDILKILKYILPTTSSYAELLCLGFAIYFLSKDKASFWRISIWYLVVVMVTEVVGRYCAVTYRTNLFVYNIYTLFEISYVTYGFHTFIKQYADIKKWIIAIYGIILLIYITFTSIYGINVYNAFTISIMSVIFVIYGLLYFYLLLKDENYIDLKFHPAFWWVGGALIFYFGSTLANFFDEIIQQKFLGKYNTRSIIYTTLNFFLYGLWVYSFICRARQRK